MKTKITNSKNKRKSKKKSSSDIDVFEKYLRQRIKHGVTNKSKLYLELKKQGFKYSYSTVYRLINNIMSQKMSSYKPSKHVETAPGEQAQVDWGSFGEIIVNDKARRLYGFFYILGYSRRIYVEFTVRQNLKTLQQCHINAFAQLGIPKTIVYDNIKTVVLRRDKNKNVYLNPSFSNFAQYYDFKIYVCHPYWPRAKGKVEAAVKYFRNNFMQGNKFQRDFFSLEELNKQVIEWRTTVADVRKHGTTERKPIELWQQEKPYLRFPDGYPSYQTAHFEIRFSTKDATIQYHSNWYEVPKDYARKKLYIKEINNNGVPLIDIYHEHETNVIAKYYVSTDRRQWITLDKSLIQVEVPGKDESKSIKLKTGKKKKAKNKTNYPKVNIPDRSLNYYNKFVSWEG